jgi:hypothetical protein
MDGRHKGGHDDEGNHVQPSYPVTFSISASDNS